MAHGNAGAVPLQALASHRPCWFTATPFGETNWRCGLCFKSRMFHTQKLNFQFILGEKNHQWLASWVQAPARQTLCGVEWSGVGGGRPLHSVGQVVSAEGARGGCAKAGPFGFLGKKRPLFPIHT